MKQKTLNLVLGAVALGLLSLVVSKEHQDKVAVETAIRHGEPLTAMTSASIDRITVAHPGAPEIRLEKKGDQWFLTAPVAAPGDLAPIGDLLGFAAAENEEKLDPAKVKRADLGLDPARYTVTLNDTVFAVGGIEPLRYTRYVEVDPGKPDDRIVLIKDNQSGAISADYAALVSKLLVPQGADIAAIEVPGLKIEQKDGNWTATPGNAAAKPAQIQAFVDAWKRARAVTTGKPVNDGLLPSARPEVAVVKLSDGSTLRYEIGRRESQVVFDRADLKVRYAVVEADGEALLHLPHQEAATAPASSSAGASVAPP